MPKMWIVETSMAKMGVPTVISTIDSISQYPEPFSTSFLAFLLIRVQVKTLEVLSLQP
jgi:hypothetical protein